jgi:hypothetical protein
MVVPVLFCAAAAGLVVSLFIQQPQQCGIAVGAVAVGVPVYFLKERYGLFQPGCSRGNKVDGEVDESSPLIN